MYISIMKEYVKKRMCDHTNFLKFWVISYQIFIVNVQILILSMVFYTWSVISSRYLFDRYDMGRTRARTSALTMMKNDPTLHQPYKFP